VAPVPTDTSCNSNFQADSTASQFTADWTTALGCSDTLKASAVAGVAARSITVQIGPNANLYTKSDITKAPGISGSLLNLDAGTINNYGIITTYPGQDYPYGGSTDNNSGSVINPSGQGDVVINNYGTIGHRANTFALPATAFHTVGYLATKKITLNNYGAVWTTNGTQGFLSGLSGSGGGGSPATIHNFAGARMGMSTGSPLNSGTGYNYRNAGMFLTDSWSWCTHTVAPVSFANWGYCIAAENGIFFDGTASTAQLYGGPLIPAAHDYNGNLVYGGSVSSNLAYNNLANETTCAAFPSGTPLLIKGHGGAVNPISLYNSFYTYTDPTDGTTSKSVNYLPLIYGYPIVGTGPGAQITFNFDRLYDSQVTQFQAALAAANTASFTIYDAKLNQFVAPVGTSKGRAVVGGFTYRWCNTGAVKATFANTIAGSPPPPEIYYGAGRTRFTDSTNPTNPYYLINPSTVQLTGNVDQPAGKLVVGPGWTLVVGAAYLQDTPLSTDVTLLPKLNSSNWFDNPNPAPTGGTELAKAQKNVAKIVSPATFALPLPVGSNSIELQSATGTTFTNVDNDVTKKSELLLGGLVIDNNPTTGAANDIQLPNLSGSGFLMQSGKSTTTLTGTNNTLSGKIYVQDGTLKLGTVAAFNPAPRIVIGSNDGFAHSPKLDISGMTASTFTVSELTIPGPQISVSRSNSSTGLFYPVINLGSKELVVDSAAAPATTNKFQGALQGTGKLRVAPGTTLWLGFATYQDYSSGMKDISTFDGRTQIDVGAKVLVTSRGAFGKGSVSNAGTIGLTNSTQYIAAKGYITNPPTNPSLAGTLPIGSQIIADPTSPFRNTLSNHTVYVAKDYVQSSSGELILKVNGGDISAQTGSGAGIQYETLAANGVVNLDGSLTLYLIGKYAIPPEGVTLLVATSSVGITGQFKKVYLTQDGINKVEIKPLLQEVRPLTNPAGQATTYALLITLK
jgi:autotransporter-associated beta strand protein